MKARHLHHWEVDPQEAREIQRWLVGQVTRGNELKDPCFIAGVDISGEGRSGLAQGAVVVLNYPRMELVEVQVVEGKPGFPYIPGLLSFREAPLVVAACEKLTVVPDLLLVDGHGIAHPRRMGLASHLGLLLDLPSIGCAKSILCGRHVPLGEESQAELVDKGEVVGMALRTKHGAAPVYVSIGHRVNLPTAVYWVKQCCRGYRLPEPTRLAHLAAGGKLKDRAVF